MSESPAPINDSNPFSTRFVRSGALPFHFPPGESVNRLLEHWLRAGKQGQILGPHGSGKSTLLAALVDELRRSSERVVHVILHDDQKRLPPEIASQIASEPCTLAIDGFEQLSFWQRKKYKDYGRRGTGLLITSHQDMGLPTIFETNVTFELANTLVNQLLSHQPNRIEPQTLRRAFDAHSGNLRDVWSQLYDVWESREPPNAAPLDQNQPSEREGLTERKEFD